MIPMRKGGELRSLQFIRGNGEKRFLPDGEVIGLLLRDRQAGRRALRLRGIRHGREHPRGDRTRCRRGVQRRELAAGGASAAGEVPRAAADPLRRRRLPDRGQPGLTKATEAARAVGGKLAIPDFGSDRPAGMTDFNDLAQLRGAEAVRQAIEGRAGAAGDCGRGRRPRSSRGRKRLRERS